MKLYAASGSRRLPVAIMAALVLLAGSGHARAHVGSGSGGGDVFLLFAGVGLATLGIGALVPAIHNLKDAAQGVRASNDWLGGGYAAGTISLGLGALMLVAKVRNPEKLSAAFVAGGVALTVIGALAIGGTVWSHTRSPLVAMPGSAQSLRSRSALLLFPALRF